METETTDVWLAINPTSYYQEACVQHGLCKANQYLVINYSKWIIWYQESMQKGVYQKPPTPAFASDIYSVVLDVARELNTPTTQQEMKG